MDPHGSKTASRSEDARPGRSAKKAYRSPQLTEYGNVAKLTQSTAGSGADGGRKASQMKTCL